MAIMDNAMGNAQGEAGNQMRDRYLKLKAKADKGEIMSAEAREEYNRLRPNFEKMDR